MSNKILLIDIGNSFTSLAELDADFNFRNSDILNWPIKPLSESRTEDFISNFLAANLFHYDKIIVSSVVTKANDLFKSLPQTIFVSYLNIPLKLNLKKPEQIGADRLVNALAGYYQTNSSTLIIDSGTATTFCYVDQYGVYQGGVILPGLEISSKALNDYTSKVPLIWVKEKKELFGKDTKEAVEIGLFNSFIFTINGLICSYRNFDPKIKILGTGSAIKEFKNHLKIDFFDDNLIFKGLAIFFDRER